MKCWTCLQHKNIKKISSFDSPYEKLSESFLTKMHTITDLYMTMCKPICVTRFADQFQSVYRDEKVQHFSALKSSENWKNKIKYQSSIYIAFH